MAAMSWQELPGFMAALREREGVPARSLEFVILTASRSGEGRGASWNEVEGDVWVVPPERMKLGLQHRVPLSDTALAVLDRVRGLDQVYCFPSPSRDQNGHSRPQFVMVFEDPMKRMGVEGITTHGFRSAFRDWASEEAKAPREVAEAALAHSVSSEVERAHARSDLFDLRRVVMEQWAQHCIGGSGHLVRIQAWGGLIRSIRYGEP